MSSKIQGILCWRHGNTPLRKLEVPGIEPGASCMLSTRSTTELHPLPLSFPQNYSYDLLIHLSQKKLPHEIQSLNFLY